MQVFKKPLCIIPARGGSKRFPRKNIALLKGKPLLCYAIEIALESNIFEEICVSSEDEEILSIVSRYPEIKALKRSEQLASDQATLKQVCLDLLNSFENKNIFFESFMLLLPTSPLRTVQDLQNAYKLFIQKKTTFLMSVVPFSHPPQRAVCVKNGKIQPYWGSKYMIKTQELEPLYRHDGSIIIAKSEAFLREKTFYGSRVVPFFVSPEASVDIDNPIDLQWAEFLLEKQYKKEKDRQKCHQL